MKINIYYFGKKNEITPREKDLLKRISYRCEVQILPLSPGGIKDPTLNIKKEAETFLNKFPPTTYLIALDEKGTEHNSVDFSHHLYKKIVQHTTLSFVIGGAYGLSPLLREKADEKISLGKMVWTRELCRHMLLEQIYRALEIQNNSGFHKGDL